MSDGQYYGKVGDKYIVCFLFDEEKLASDIGAFVHSLMVSLGKE